MTYEVVTDNAQKILYSISKAGNRAEVLRVVDTPVNRLLIVNKYRVQSLRFKSDTPVKLVKSGNSYTAIISDELQIYKLPHYAHLHSEIMTANRSMLHISTSKLMQTVPVIRDNLSLDIDGIIDNMLELIAKI